LIVTDDDISGTFTFLRAMLITTTTAPYGSARSAKPGFNYLIEGRTVLWWGGLGNSTETPRIYG